MPDSQNRVLTAQPDLDEHDRGAKLVAPPTSSWARRTNFFFLGMLALWTSTWALKQLGWLFGWTAEPVQGHLSQIFDTMVILASGIVLFAIGIRLICRKDGDRQAKLDRMHDMAARVREAKSSHA